MAKLNQIVALETGTKAAAKGAMEAARRHLSLTRGEGKNPMAGLERTYQPRAEDGDMLPSESATVQLTVEGILAELLPSVRRLFDVTATKETSNQHARADVEVDGLTIADVPVTVLLFLERQLGELTDFARTLPVLDPAETWRPYEPGVYRAEERTTTRTVKQPRAFVMYEATKEHPAQVQMVADDKIVGDWTAVKYSGALPAADKAALLERLRKLTEAVQVAREEANSLHVTDTEIGLPVLRYLFPGIL